MSQNKNQNKQITPQLLLKELTDQNKIVNKNLEAQNTLMYLLNKSHLLFQRCIYIN